MIRDWARVEDLQRRYQREALRDLDYPEALRRSPPSEPRRSS